MDMKSNSAMTIALLATAVTATIALMGTFILYYPSGHRNPSSGDILTGRDSGSSDDYMDIADDRDDGDDESSYDDNDYIRASDNNSNRATEATITEAVGTTTPNSDPWVEPVTSTSGDFSVEFLELLQQSRSRVQQIRLLALLFAHPELAGIRSVRMEKYPVHLLCSSRSGVSLLVLERLIELCPAALTATDSFFAATPLHYLVQSCGNYCIQHSNNHDSQGQGHSYSGVRDAEQMAALALLVDRCPAALFLPDVAGFLPLHCALHVYRPCFSVVKLLLEECVRHWPMHWHQREQLVTANTNIGTVADVHCGASCVLGVRTRAGLTPMQLLFQSHSEDSTVAYHHDHEGVREREAIRALLQLHLEREEEEEEEEAEEKEVEEQ